MDLTLRSGTGVFTLDGKVLRTDDAPIGQRGHINFGARPSSESAMLVGNVDQWDKFDGLDYSGFRVKPGIVTVNARTTAGGPWRGVDISCRVVTSVLYGQEGGVELRFTSAIGTLAEIEGGIGYRIRTTAGTTYGSTLLFTTMPTNPRLYSEMVTGDGGLDSVEVMWKYDATVGGLPVRQWWPPDDITRPQRTQAIIFSPPGSL